MIGCLAQLKVAKVCCIPNVIASVLGTNKQRVLSFPDSLLHWESISKQNDWGLWGVKVTFFFFFFWRRFPQVAFTHQNPSPGVEVVIGRPPSSRLQFWADSHGTQVCLPLCELLTCCQWNEEVGATNDGEDTGTREFSTILQKCRESAMFRVTGEILLLFVPLLLQLRSQQCDCDWIMSQFSDELNTRLHKSCMRPETLHQIELVNEPLLNGHGLMRDE